MFMCIISNEVTSTPRWSSSVIQSKRWADRLKRNQVTILWAFDTSRKYKIWMRNNINLLIQTMSWDCRSFLNCTLPKCLKSRHGCFFINIYICSQENVQRPIHTLITSLPVAPRIYTYDKLHFYSLDYFQRTETGNSSEGESVRWASDESAHLLY